MCCCDAACVRVAGTKKRRRGAEERRKIVEATLQPGASVSRVARRHDVNASRHFLAWCVERKIELVHIQPGRPMQNGRVESFHGRLREECLNVSWFGNLYEARGKIAAWRKDYNEERPHSSLGYRTPKEFARELGAENGCGKDGGFAPLENASRFPLSHSPGGDGIATAVQVNGPDAVL